MARRVFRRVDALIPAQPPVPSAIWIYSFNPSVVLRIYLYVVPLLGFVLNTDTKTAMGCGITLKGLRKATSKKRHDSRKDLWNLLHAAGDRVGAIGDRRRS